MINFALASNIPLGSTDHTYAPAASGGNDDSSSDLVELVSSLFVLISGMALDEEPCCRRRQTVPRAAWLMALARPFPARGKP
ncbi:hypothetical protein TIFTF001_038594 [Ficus carica]|uniref:Uncharacterized protein n=1 Tax=Ficus carica TaxID=3494 RepID=A0AA88JD78_FICCA|nr:hypothetical protein TIFTF001_038594 [Ficus carica]